MNAVKPIDKAHAAKCPRTYIMWTFVVAGMVAAFIGYIIVTPMEEFIESAEPLIPVGATTGNLILTEHANEEDDYEKPVCKRLEDEAAEDRY